MDGKTRLLTGKRILVTRPKHQAEGLCAAIEDLGGRAELLPILDIVPIADAEPPSQLLARPGGWDWVIFVSANAVRFGLPLLAGKQLPGRVAAVGEATGRSLVSAGIRVDLIPKPQFNSESLLASPEFAEILGKRMLIVRGQEGREHLAESLRSRGAEVAYAEVYRREFAADRKHWEELVRETSVDAVVVTSGEALGHFTKMVSESLPALLIGCPLVVIGERIAHLAQNAGWRVVITAPEASDAGLLQALAASLGRTE